MTKVIFSFGWEAVSPLVWPFVEVPLGCKKGAASRDHTDVALKGKRNSIVDPAINGAMMALIVP